ncbi:MAG: hypothetical protein SF162_11685 [bacterium]|nr:hypothetical protein [bacterium]
MERIFDSSALVVLLILAFIASIIGLVLGVTKGENARSMIRFFEALIVTFLGGLFARMFIGGLLELANNNQDAATVLTWFFFLPNAVFEFVLAIRPSLDGTFTPFLTSPDGVRWTATLIGAFTGAVGGIWATYRWDRLGIVAFLLDVTWALNGSYLSALLHLVDFSWADKADAPASGTNLGDRRRNNHRYRKGFAFKPNFALTLGNTMSNCIAGRDPSVGLWVHENTHVWQNRAFGPLFTLSYLAWLIVTTVLFGAWAGLVAYGGARRRRDGTAYPLMERIVNGATDVGYLSNPWEAWAYKVGEGYREPYRGNFGGPLVWADGVVIAFAIPYFLIVIGLMIAAFVAAW